jgi:hypothetical protein
MGNDFQDHVVGKLQVDPNDSEAAAMLKESIADRVEGTAEKRGLTQEQRDHIKASDSGLAVTYASQRDQRPAARTPAAGGFLVFSASAHKTICPS